MISTLLRPLRALWSFFQKGKWQKALVLGGIVVLIVVVAQLTERAPADTSIAVVRGSISQTVSVTGQLKPAESVNLSFGTSGRVSQVPVNVGDHVVVGQLLASLDTGVLTAQLRDAQAGVLAQQAKLDELINGARPEDLAAKEAEYKQAERTLHDEYANIYDVLLDGYTKASNAVHIQLSDLFDSEGTVSAPAYRLSFSCSSCDQASRAATDARASTEIILGRWQAELSAIALNSSTDMLVRALSNAIGYLQTTRTLLDNTAIVLNGAGIGLDVTTLQTYRTNVNTGTATVVTALTTANAQKQTIASQELTVERIANELALKRAGSTPEAIAAQRAAVLSAQAQVQRAQAQISDGMIRSPIVGIVTQQDAKRGQTAPANTTLIAVMSDQQLEIEANVPEVDIGRVAVGNPVNLTVDALPGETLTATVTFIDPAETVVDGVVNFKVTMLLVRADERLKSGLTVNLDIDTLRHDDVLILPQYAIVENDQGTFVRKLVNGTSTQIPVQLGIRSQDGRVEVVSGVAENDRVENIGLKTNE